MSIVRSPLQLSRFVAFHRSLPRCCSSQLFRATNPSQCDRLFTSKVINRLYYPSRTYRTRSALLNRSLAFALRSARFLFAKKKRKRPISRDPVCRISVLHQNLATPSNAPLRAITYRTMISSPAPRAAPLLSERASVALLL